MKPETRNQNGESILKPETGKGFRSVIQSFSHSDLIRHSDFGFRISAAARRGFTLVELMLSLAMVMLLIVGINYVFRSASDVVGAGQSLNGINRDTQSAQPMLFDDVRDATKNPPCFIIASQLVTQFLNSDDAKTSSDPSVIVTDNAGTEIKIANSATIGTAQGDFAATLSPAILNNRNHRADLLKFFARNTYGRHSGNDGVFTGSETSNDAFIEIGHAALPINNLNVVPAFYGPSSLPNTSTSVSNYMYPVYPLNTVVGVPRVGTYASDWVLARRITLLLPGTPWTGTPAAPNPQSIAPYDYYYPIDTSSTPPISALVNTQYPASIDGQTAFGWISSPPLNMSPLSYGTRDFYYDPSGKYTSPEGVTQFQSSRYDLAGVTPDQYDRIVANAILGWQTAGYYGSSLWWNPLVYSVPISQQQAAATPPQYWPMTNPSTGLASAPYVIPYYQAPNVLATKATLYTSILPKAPVNSFSRSPFNDPSVWLDRPQCNPLIQSPLSAAALAEMAPFFLQHCSQFIVEYAGDYMQQQNDPTQPRYGDMTGLGPDGQIDYYVDAAGNKHIRWYGMPRSSTGQPHPDGRQSGGGMVLIRGFDPTVNGGQGETLNDPTIASGPAGSPPMVLLNYFTDVIPLRDYYCLWFSTQNSLTAIPGYRPGSFSPPWEVDVNFDCTRDYGAYFNPLTNTVNFPPQPNTGVYDNAFNDHPPNPTLPPRYVAAWHDDMPAMIRILIKVDDPNNKIKDGPWYEFVFRLK